MQGSIAQTITFAIHGNAKIRGIASDRIFPDHSTCKFCRSIKFVARGMWRVREYAATPDEWLEKLIARGAGSFVVRYDSVPHPAKIGERMTVAFVGGGGRWTIVANLPEGSESWRDRWELGDRNAPDQRIWNVTYTRVANGPRELPPGVDLRAVTSEFRDALVDIKSFAQAHDLGFFADCFDRALAALDSRPPREPRYYADMAPPAALPDDAAALLASVSEAWVFGGMGSWNDVVFDGADGAEYDRVSERLYAVINRAIVAAANASVPG